MWKLGIDLGTSTIKLAVLDEENDLKNTWTARHHGVVLPVLRRGLEELDLPEEITVSVTGSNSALLSELCPYLDVLGDIPAAVEGTRLLVPDAGSILEIGSQSARFITDLSSPAPAFAVNEHCAGGTGSFFEDQMSRLGLKIEDFSDLVDQAADVPRISGRCAVFAKTDIIHRQQEGAETPDILLGLCYSMIRNYKATIVRSLKVEKPVVFGGGVTQNRGVIRAIRDVFGLEEDELVVPENALLLSAIGAATVAGQTVQISNLKSELLREDLPGHTGTLNPLHFDSATSLKDPEATGVIPPEGCALGIDIGSTSTDLVLIGKDGSLIDFQYLRTAGDPEGVVRAGLDAIHQKFGDVKFLSVGVTGSGRDRVGKMVGADAIRDEITAQAKGAVHWVPEVDTVFEIGGQDSKYISIKDGQVVDFQMNKICAAGTGSFVEEEAVRLGIPLDEFGPKALAAKKPADLGERCTVFIQTAVTSAEAEGVTQDDLAAGLCHSIIKNYLHKVVSNKPVGQHIVLQGGVCYNPGIVAAFQSVYGDRVTVSPCFSISGAYGAALLALEHAANRGWTPSTFHGFSETEPTISSELSEEVRRNTEFYNRSWKRLLKDYDPTIDPKKQTVGVPMVLVMHKLFPMAYGFFKSLGYNVVISDYSDEEAIRLSQEYANGETCYPVKLIYGHMMKLVQKKVDYIFLPLIHTMQHSKTAVDYSFGCVYMQSAAVSIGKALKLEEKGITLLSPVFDLNFGAKALAMSMIGVGQQLGFSKPRSMKALLTGAKGVVSYTLDEQKMGKELLETLKPEDKVIVLITRPYGLGDPVLNMQIPQILLERGQKVITLENLPGDDVDVSEDYSSIFWPFGEHILGTAKIIAHHPNLYAVYLTNHGCGPDTMLSHLFKEEMGDKPYLQIEVDEHFSPVGVITRIEAFLNSISHRQAESLGSDFDIKAVAHKKPNIQQKPVADRTLYVPDFGFYTDSLAAYYKEAYGIAVRPMDRVDEEVLELGRAGTSSKEYVPFPALLGEVLSTAAGQTKSAQYLIPATMGAEAEGIYHRAIRTELDRLGMEKDAIIAPPVDGLTRTAQNPDLLFRALAFGDLIYAAPRSERAALLENFTTIPTWESLVKLAASVGKNPITGKKLAVVGTPMCMTSLDNGILDALEEEENTVLRTPLSEALWYLATDTVEPVKDAERDRIEQQLHRISAALGARSTFTLDKAAMVSIADQYLANFHAGNGRYRFAKSVLLGTQSDAVLTMAPRYENTATVLNMRGLTDACPAPLYQINLDEDWDETQWSHLRSFLYYLPRK